MILCAAPGCQPVGADGPARAVDGLLLCRHHVEGIGRDALRLPALHDELTEALSGGGGTGDGGASGRGDHPGLALNEAAGRARRDIRTLLTETVTTIVKVRGIDPPMWPITLRLPRGVHGPRQLLRWTPDGRKEHLAEYVAEHRMWLAARPDAGDIADAYAYNRRRANGILYAEHTRVILIGACPREVIPGQPCRGTVRALVKPSDELLPLAVTCEDPEHTWPVAELSRLGRWIGLKSGRWNSATELAILYGLPMRRIHQLASIHRWERTRDGHRPVLYSARDAENVLGRGVVS